MVNRAPWRALLHPRFSGIDGRSIEYAIVLEGVAQIAYGTQVIHAETGTSISLKRGIPHGWGNPTDKPIRLLMIASPGGCEEALRIIARGGLTDF